ncbi:MAG: alpha/beta fold hydrolase [Lysobacter sp.]|nr:alpha/beta fold hydrolase [Lysobacter sp.]
MRNFLLIAAAAVLLGYLGICWFLHAKQRDMIYYGWTTTVDAASTDFALKRPDATLRGWVANPDKPDPILYFGGNAERVESNREAFALLFPGRSVYFLAYRGYGASEGAPSEAALVPDALAFFDDVQRRHPGQKIAVIGRSLGSGIASQVAAQRPVERLVLVTPFDSMVGAARSHYPMFPVGWLLDERYESDKALRRFKQPMLIVHGGRDDVVPEANTLRLIAALPAPPTVVRIAKADHNDISNYPEFVAALLEFFQR